MAELWLKGPAKDEYQDASNLDVKGKRFVKANSQLRPYNSRTGEPVAEGLDNEKDSAGAGRGKTPASKYAKGGTVRGWGKARGARKAKYV